MDYLLIHLSNVAPRMFGCSVACSLHYGYTRKSKNGAKYYFIKHLFWLLRQIIDGKITAPEKVL